MEFIAILGAMRYEGDCLPVDNAKIHLGEMVREIIEQQKARLIYLPPYSP